MERDANGDLSVGATHGGLLGYVAPMRREESVDDDGLQAEKRGAVVYLQASAPVATDHLDWRVLYNGQEMEVMQIKREENPVTGLLSHWRLTVE